MIFTGWHTTLKTEKKQNTHGPLPKQKLLLDLIQKNKADTRTELS